MDELKSLTILNNNFKITKKISPCNCYTIEIAFMCIDHGK